MSESQRHELPRGPLKLLTLFQGFSKTCRELFPSREYLARKLGVSARTITRWIAALAARSLIEVRRRGPTSCLFILLVDVQSNVQSFAFYPCISTSNEVQEKTRGRVLQFRPRRESVTAPLAYPEPYRE